MPVAFTKLMQFPRNRLIDAEALRGSASELDLLAAFGPPTVQSAASEPEPLFFWDIEWDCGLVMSLRLNQLTEELVIRLSEADARHALRHLPFEVRASTVEADDPVDLRRVADGPDTTWELWERDGDNGRRTVEAGLSERGARCLLAQIDPDDQDRFGVSTAPPAPPTPAPQRNQSARQR